MLANFRWDSLGQAWDGHRIIRKCALQISLQYQLDLPRAEGQGLVLQVAAVLTMGKMMQKLVCVGQVQMMPSVFLLQFWNESRHRWTLKPSLYPQCTAPGRRQSSMVHPWPKSTFFVKHFTVYKELSSVYKKGFVFLVLSEFELEKTPHCKVLVSQPTSQMREGKRFGDLPTVFCPGTGLGP